ncbi:hypothetical protein TSUD_203670, partial [Trifolium subterraneum]
GKGEMVRCEKQYGEEHPLVLSDPMVLEITRLQNQFKEKVKELATYQSEIKALKSTEALKDKAIVELRNDVSKLDEKLSITEDYLKQKNVEIKKLADEKKGALAAQYAAEATLRRVHANQKNEYSAPIDTVIAPLEAEIKMYRNEEENKILEKTLRQKIIEVEKLSHTIQELEEVILANGATANEEKRTLERELAIVKVSANRIANVVANDWKDENDKMQRLKEKLAISERTVKAESQLKEKLKVRLNTLEEGLKHFSSYPATSNVFSWSPKAEKSNIKGSLTTSGGARKRSTSQPRASSIGSPLFHQRNIKTNTNTVGGNLKQESPMKMKYASAENMLKKGIWTSRSKVADITGEKENEMQVNTDINLNNINAKTIVDEDEDFQSKKPNDSGSDDVVSGFLYDRLQKDMLIKKVDALIKAMDVEWKKMKREAAAREKEVSAIKPDDNRKNRNTNSSKRVMNER